jgi:hypothetical protein
MNKLFRCVVFAVATAGVVSSASAGDLTVQIAGGKATVIAKDVTLRQILAEWARVGDTKIVNGEKLAGGPISLELIDVPEKEALDILLRSAAGYVTGPRQAGVVGASLYDRVMILPTSRPPASTGVTAPPSPFNRTAIPQMPPQQAPPDDDGEPGDQGPVPPPGMVPFGPNQGMPFPGQMPQGPNANPNNPNVNPNNPNANPNNPNANPNNPNPTQVPTTAPRPGQLPQQPMPVNPYSPLGRPNGPNGQNPNAPNGRGGGPGGEGGV